MFVPMDSVKFRELSQDSVQYLLPGHSVEYPKTITVSRNLPIPRRGNRGTNKTTINTHIYVNVGTTESPKIVPVVCRLEVSAPVGCSREDIIEALFATTHGVGQRVTAAVAANTSLLDDANDGISNLLRDGILPEGVSDWATNWG
jgi:hypothetical protein